jgi:hypothetical protein
MYFCDKMLKRKKKSLYTGHFLFLNADEKKKKEFWIEIPQITFNNHKLYKKLSFSNQL